MLLQLPIAANTQDNLEEEEEVTANEEIEDVQIPAEEYFEESMDSVASTNRPGPVTTNENSQISTKASAATKRVQPPTPTSSQKKKRQKTTTDERLDKAFEILTSTSSTPILDDSYHFGNLIASKLRLYNDDVRCAIQSDIFNIFLRANRGYYNNRVSVLPDHVHYTNPPTSHTYTSPHSSLSSSSSQPPWQSSNHSQSQNQYQFQDQSQKSNQSTHTYQASNDYGEESGIQSPTTSAFLINTPSYTLPVDEALQQL